MLISNFAERPIGLERLVRPDIVLCFWPEPPTPVAVDDPMSNLAAQFTQLPLGQGQTATADLVSVTEAKNQLAKLIERVRAHERVVITRNDRPIAVLLSIEDYTAMAESIPDPLRELQKRFQGLRNAIGGPGLAAASAALHVATPDQLGAAAQAAVERAQRG